MRGEVGRGQALALAAAGGILTALGACTGAARTEHAATPGDMPEYPPVVVERRDGGTRPEAGGTTSGRVAARRKAKDCCRGFNACKGKGYCKTERNACRGQNTCKGQGGCKPTVCP